MYTGACTILSINCAALAGSVAVHDSLDHDVAPTSADRVVRKPENPKP